MSLNAFDVIEIRIEFFAHQLALLVVNRLLHIYFYGR